jgi:hypothetical protein
MRCEHESVLYSLLHARLTINGGDEHDSVKKPHCVQMRRERQFVGTFQLLPVISHKKQQSRKQHQPAFINYRYQPYTKSKSTMKLNRLSLLSFFAIAIAVSGQSLRGDKDLHHRDTALQELEQEQNDEPIVTLDLADNEAHLEFFDNGDAIVITGTAANSEEGIEQLGRLRRSSPVDIFEKLSGKAAPDELVNAQNRIEKLMGTPTTSPEVTAKVTNYNVCEDYFSKTGNLSFLADTTKMGGVVVPTRGCVAIKGERWNGSKWITINNTVGRACVGGSSTTKVWGSYKTYSIDIFEANGDQYDVRVCWD